MLYFVSAELALAYWLFAFLCAIGALQWVAARYHLGGLSFLNDCCWSGVEYRPPSRNWGYALATLCVVGSATGFFITQWEAIFAPGPAGSELAVLFATSAACALAVTVAVAALLQRWRQARTSLEVGEGGQPVAVGHATGYIYPPAGPSALGPAVCLLPAYPAKAGWGAGKIGDGQHLTLLARRLAQEGVLALLIRPDEQSYAYPGSLAILPAAVAVLSKRSEVDAERIGALGEDLGGDLVIRAASTSKEIKAVAAVAPILADAPAGLDLLHEMSYLRALRWARDRRRSILCRELNAAEYSERVSPRPFLLLYGEQDQLVGDPWKLLHLPQEVQKDSGRDNGIQVQVIPGVGHFHLAGHPLALQTICRWLKEHL